MGGEGADEATLAVLERAARAAARHGAGPSGARRRRAGGAARSRGRRDARGARGPRRAGRGVAEAASRFADAAGERADDRRRRCRRVAGSELRFLLVDNYARYAAAFEWGDCDAGDGGPGARVAASDRGGARGAARSGADAEGGAPRDPGALHRARRTGDRGRRARALRLRRGVGGAAARGVGAEGRARARHVRRRSRRWRAGARVACWSRRVAASSRRRESRSRRWGWMRSRASFSAGSIWCRTERLSGADGAATVHRAAVRPGAPGRGVGAGLPAGASGGLRRRDSSRRWPRQGSSCGRRCLGWTMRRGLATRPWGESGSSSAARGGCGWASPPPRSTLSDRARAVLGALRQQGASFVGRPAGGHRAWRRRGRATRLHELVAAGLVTNDTVGALRDVLRWRPVFPAKRRDEPDPTRWLPADYVPSGRPDRAAAREPAATGEVAAAGSGGRKRSGAGGGRWCTRRARSVPTSSRRPSPSESRGSGSGDTEWWRATGGSASARPSAGATSIRSSSDWSFEATCRRGYFVAGLTGAQFALPEAVEMLRAPAGEEAEPVVMAASDPANVYALPVPRAWKWTRSRGRAEQARCW